MVKTVPEMLRALSPSRYSTAFATSSTPARRRNALRPTTLRRCSSANPCGEADDRGDVDDAAGPVRHHRPHDIFGQHDRRQRVDAHELLDLRVVHHRERAVDAERGIVDQAEQRTEFLAQPAHQIGYLRRSCRGRTARNAARLARALGFGDGGGQFLVFCRATAMTSIAGGGELAAQCRGRGRGCRRSRAPCARCRVWASHAQPCRRANLPVAATASAGTKLIAAGTL